MARELVTLSGALPGLLRRGSPVAGGSVVVRVRAGYAELADGEIVPVAEVLLDLDDPTGRAHALWWLLEQSDALALAAREVAPSILRDECLRFAPTGGT